ncbi:MAG: hypothetical protein NTV62_01945 [Candidatus Gribaldobacteria bacterium]|nr:hypothetical protein [Candidatus Gribaldobacteria bacterium]
MEFSTIKQLKKLQGVKPEIEWTKSLKEQILKGDHYYLNAPAVWDVFGLMKRSWVLSSVVALLLVSSGFFAYTTYINKMFVQDLLARLNTTNQSINQTKLVASLEEMKTSLQVISGSLDNLKLAKNKKEALVTASVVKATAKYGQVTVQNIRASDGGVVDGKVLASLNETEKQFQNMEKMATAVQNEFIASLIADLKTRSLTVNNAELLKKAEEDFTAGRIEEAAMGISWINQ